MVGVGCSCVGVGGGGVGLGRGVGVEGSGRGVSVGLIVGLPMITGVGVGPRITGVEVMNSPPGTSISQPVSPIRVKAIKMAQKRIDKLKEDLTKIAERRYLSQAEDTDPPVISTLKQRLTELELEKAALGQKY